MKKIKPIQITVCAFCVALNISGAFIALSLKLPVYMDSIGTILAGALLGPLFGAATGFISGVLSGITSDIYALYFMPAGVITGVISGILFKTSWFNKIKIILGTAFLTAPGTFLGACISAFVFGGVTSSGSSIIVQFLNSTGLNLVASAFIVQFITDYADRFISVTLVCIIISRLSDSFKLGIRGGSANE